jgi:hypothetical protein
MNSFWFRYAVALLVSSAVFFALTIFVLIDNQMSWILRFKSYKYGRAASIQSQKVLVNGGSSMLYGLSAKVMEEELGIPAVNLGINGGFSLPFLIEETKKVAKPHDIVIFAPEYPVYSRQAAAWQDLDYHYFRLKDPSKLMMFTPRAIMSYALQTNVLDSALSTGTILIRNLVSGPYGQPSDLNVNGDYDACAATNHTNPNPFAVDIPDLVVAGDALKSLIQDLGAWGRENKIQLFITMPNIARHPDFAKPAWKDKSAAFTSILATYGVEVLGTPEDAVYDPSNFCDSYYHMNKTGSERRTKDFISKFGSRFHKVQ